MFVCGQRSAFSGWAEHSSDSDARRLPTNCQKRRQLAVSQAELWTLCCICCVWRRAQFWSERGVFWRTAGIFVAVKWRWFWMSDLTARITAASWWRIVWPSGAPRKLSSYDLLEIAVGTYPPFLLISSHECPFPCFHIRLFEHTDYKLSL